ncbi:hypothetical protein HDU67_009890, partial [Dinochytrium kinnereticum]
GDATRGSYMSAGAFAILYPFRFWRLHVALLKIVKPNRIIFFKFSAVTQKSIAIALTILNLLLTVTAFVHMVERTQEKNKLHFWEVFYWIFVTSSSGLSTNIVPDDLISRIVIIANRVTYIKGSTMNTKDLDKTKISLARACFILSSNYADRDSSEVDAEAVMRAISVKKFSRSTKILAQVVLPPNKLHFDSLAEHVLCLEEFKLGIIAQNCIASGFTTLVNILITSVPEPSIRAFHRSYSTKKGGIWVKEYVQGLHMEIYSVNISPCFRGMTFKVAAERVFLRHHAILFAIATNHKHVNAGDNPLNDSILMNPVDYVMKGGEHAYMIAMDSFTADKVAGDAEWLFEPNKQGEVEWEREWDFEPLGQEVEDVGIVRKWSRKVASAISWNQQDKASLSRENSMDNKTDALGSADSSTSSSLKQHDSILEKSSPPREASQKIPLRSTSLTALKVDITLGGSSTNGEITSPVSDIPTPTPDSPEKSRSDLVFMGVKSDSYSSDDVAPQNLEMALAPAPPTVIKTNQSEKAVGKMPKNPFQIFLPRSETPQQEILSPVSPNASNLCDHLLISSLNTDRFPSNLAFLIAPIRLRYPATGIVILSPMEPDEDEKTSLLAYGLVFIVNGSALKRNDLKKCGVERIQKAVVLASIKESNVTERTADAPALLAVLNIEAMAKNNVFITVEFLHTSNMKLMGSGEEYYSKIDVYGHSIMPAFASGHVFSKSMLNTLLVQTYYNPHLLVILKHLIFSYKSYATNPVRQGSTTSLWGEPTEACNDETEHGQVFKIRIPKKYIGQKYALLVVKCLREHSALCLALYRLEDVKGHDVRYLFLNPPSSTKIRKGDAVFLLAGSEPAL